MTWPPQRWDIGKWDSTSTWDGQLGLDAVAGSIVVTPYAAGLRKTRGMAANKGSIVVGAQTAALRTSRRLTAQPGAIVLTGQAAEFTYTPVAGELVMDASPGAIVVSGNAADLSVLGAPPYVPFYPIAPADLRVRRAWVNPW